MVRGTEAMAIRTFRASDGTRWTVWLVRSGSMGSVPGTPAEWLAFQNDEGTERRRLMEIPPDWAELPDERMDLLRRIAEPAILLSRHHSPPGGIERLAATRDKGER